MNALRAGRFPKEANNVIFQVNYLKVHNGWAWASVTPQDHNGIHVAERCSALLHFEDGMWKTAEPGKLPIDTAKMNGEKGVDRAFVNSILEALPAVSERHLPEANGVKSIDRFGQTPNEPHFSGTRGPTSLSIIRPLPRRPASPSRPT